MSTVALHSDHVHDIIAQPYHQSLTETGLTTVAILMLLALAVFQSLKAVARALGASVAASLLLLRPLLALTRLLFTVLVLIAVAVAVIVARDDDAGSSPVQAPTSTEPAPAPAPIRSLLPVPTR